MFGRLKAYSQKEWAFLFFASGLAPPVLRSPGSRVVGGCALRDVGYASRTGQEQMKGEGN